MTLPSALLLAAVTVGTWNGEWFPSGRAEHRAAREIERGVIRAAGRMLRDGLARADPTGTNDLILCFNEFRRDTDGESVAEMLCREIGRTDLRVAVVSGYRRRDRFDQQQDVIVTTLPVVEANWSVWKRGRNKEEAPPRGYARAKIVVSPAVTATVYSVHLKSNYGQTSAEIAAANRRKRTQAIEQLVGQEKPRRGKSAPVIIAGDLNADRWHPDGAGEPMFAVLEEAGFTNVLERLPPAQRVTYPGRGRIRNRALDYIMVRGLRIEGLPLTASGEGISDHNALFINLK
ncbi:MAG: endonuclease/exonuclease/phosphatase family protein [Kiritimatiellia bacterium]